MVRCAAHHVHFNSFILKQACKPTNACDEIYKQKKYNLLCTFTKPRVYQNALIYIYRLIASYQNGCYIETIVTLNSQKL